MKKILIAVIVLPTQALADEECLFDQAFRRKEALRLQAEYPDSRLSDDEFAVIITRDEDELTVTVGGCVHWGVAVEAQTSRLDVPSTQDAFFAEIMELVIEFGGEWVDVEQLNRIIDDERWVDTSDEGARSYLLDYSGMTAFEVYQAHVDTQTRVGFRFYR